MKYYINDKTGSTAMLAAGEPPQGHKEVTEKQYVAFVEKLESKKAAKTAAKREKAKRQLDGFAFDEVAYSTTERDCDRVVAAVMTIKNGYLDEKTVAFANGAELNITTSNVDRFAAAFFLAAKESE